MSGVTKPQFVAILINLSYRDDNAYEFQNIICLLHPYTFTGDNECWAVINRSRTVTSFQATKNGRWSEDMKQQ